MAVFSQKSAFHITKVWYKVYLCDYCQRQSCNYWPIYPCKNGWRETSPSTWKFSETDRLPSTTLISNQFSLVSRLSRNTSRK